MANATMDKAGVMQSAKGASSLSSTLFVSLHFSLSSFSFFPSAAFHPRLQITIGASIS